LVFYHERNNQIKKHMTSIKKRYKNLMIWKETEKSYMTNLREWWVYEMML
jgi:hypothetical protein